MIQKFSDHDLASAGKILPPGNKIEFFLERERDSFYLVTSGTDTSEYKANLTACCLYVPIAVMSDRLTNEIYSQWEHSNMMYYFDRQIVKAITMPTNNQFFVSDSLFPQSESPFRVFVMLVDSSAFKGNYHQSPFEFRRSWKIKTSTVQAAKPQGKNDREDRLQKSVDDLKEIVLGLVAAQSLANNSENESIAVTRAKRYKNKTNIMNTLSTAQEAPNNLTETTQQGSSNFFNRIYNSFHTNEEDERESGDPSEPDESASDAPSEPILTATEKDYWIEAIELEILNSPLDAFESKGTKDEAVNDFLRLQKSINQFNQVISCGVTYKDFLNTCFIAAYDLTTNQQPNLPYNINTVRTGTKKFPLLDPFF